MRYVEGSLGDPTHHTMRNSARYSSPSKQGKYYFTSLVVIESNSKVKMSLSLSLFFF